MRSIPRLLVGYDQETYVYVTHLAISRRSALGEVHRGLVLSCLVRQVLRSCWIRSSGGIFWKVFRRSCGLPTRLVGPSDKSVGFLVDRTHLSGTAMSLVGGDPGVPMSHTCINLFFDSQSAIYLTKDPC
jgi:hypothetical protein